MAEMPRIITVDPMGNISRIVHAAMDLLDLSIIQVDVPSSADALEELARPASLVVSAFELDSDMKGFEFALRVKQSSPDSAVLILGDVDDPDDLDEETALDSPFVYLSRPVDIHQFLRVLVAGLDSHEAMINALHARSGVAAVVSAAEMGPVPNLDLDAAQDIIDSLLTDLGAMAIILASRDGSTLLERGAVGYIDREHLTTALMPIMTTNVNVKDLIGGQVSTVQFYDGDEYDVFVLSVGLHHFMCVMFDGQMGSRQFGLVNRFGRRAVEDLIALLGANAFFIEMAKPEKEKPKTRAEAARKPAEKEEEPIELARAEIEAEEEAEPEPVMERLEPIEDLDVDALFGGDLDVDEDMFDPEKLEELAKESQQGQSAIDWEQAEQLGILKK